LTTPEQLCVLALRTKLDNNEQTIASFPVNKSKDLTVTAVVTIGDVARIAGVHPASVSRALRGGNTKVSAETRSRIEKIARDIGYRPNGVAAALRTKQTNLAAIVLPDLGNPLFAPIVQAIETSLRLQGIMCLVAQTPGEARGRCDLIVALATRQVDGLLILAAETDDPMLAEARRLAIPTVLVNRGFGERRFPSVVNDDRESVRLVLEHLQGLGHQRIAHVAGPGSSSTGRARREAFESLVHQLGIDATSSEARAFTRNAGREATQELFGKGSGCTAIFAGNDLIAMGVLDVLHQRGLRVPDDMSLVGHNDMPLVDLIDPPLTTVRIAVEDMGRQAAQLLMEQMRAPGQSPSMRVLTPSLIVRRSTGPASRAEQ
jgi:LacI family transcriptional regulator